MCRFVQTNPRNVSRFSALLVLAVMATAGISLSAEQPVADLVEQIRSARLDSARAVDVEALEIDMGLARMRLVEGVLIPAAPVGGRTLEILFSGRASFEIEPPDEVEAQQLELFTDRERLDVDVTDAVLLIGNEAIVNELLEGKPQADLGADAVERAETSFGEWVEGAERRGFGGEGALFKAALGDEPAQRSFLAWVRSEEMDDFYYRLDPFLVEQVELGQFVAAELDEIDQHQIEKFIRKSRREGRYSQLRLAELGDWNTWISAAQRDASGEAQPGSEGFEPEHYVLEVELAKGETDIDGRTRIDLLCGSDGRRVVTLELFSDLEVRSVRDGDGRDLEWFRDDEYVHVALAETIGAGKRFSLDVEYGGVILDELDKGIYRMRDTVSWYPHVGTYDRATYEATLRWPKKYELLASGRIVDQGEEGGFAWQERVLDIPVFGFSFEYGAYDVRTTRAGHVDLTVAFSKMESNWDTGVKEEVLEKLAEALQFLEEQFGAYPLDHLTVATVPRGFSQGLLSFVTLAHGLVATPRGYRVYLSSVSARKQQRLETIAHELSHQWWGNMVGWYNYRDQWLSEALADFSATSFVAAQKKRSSVYLAQHARGWKRAVNTETEDGRSLESLGPVVLGHRLQSSYSRQAYSAVVYDKGSVVFSMLARSLGQEPFSEMLKTLAGAVQNRAIDTETFLMAIERMSGVELDEFAQQFIYGTGVPEVYYRYRIKQSDEGWLIEGAARQIAVAHYRYELVEDDGDKWNVVRERIPDVDVAGRFLVVPFQIALEERRAEEGKKGGASTRTERGLGGQLLLEGETTEFSIPISEEPRLFWLDQRGEVLAMFYGENHRPKRVLRYKAMELTGEDAEATLHEALSAALYSEAGLREIDLPPKELERLSRLQDAAILLELSELYLNQGRDVEARQAFDRAEDNLGGLDKRRYRVTRMMLECRFDIRESDFKSAYQRLSKNLALDFGRSSEDTVFDRARRKKFASGWRMDGDAYALLALSAFKTDHVQVARVALEEAEERGCDMTALRKLMQAEGELTATAAP
jgi:hypothetical protein